MNPTVEHYSGARAEVLTEAFNGLLFVNGGGVVALLAFLQQHWATRDNQLPEVLLGGAACMILGLIAALPIPLLRYWHSRRWEDRERLAAEGKAESAGNQRWRRLFRRLYFTCYIVSMLSFAVGATYVVWNAMNLLGHAPGTAEPTVLVSRPPGNASAMGEMYRLETPLWEIAARGTAVYLAIAVVLRIVPKRHSGNLSPNDMIALVIIGSLSADAIMGEAKALPDLLLMVVVIILCDYLFNLAEYYFPRFRRIAQDSPTLLIQNGVLLKENLRKEKLTEQEVEANLRKRGVADVARVKQAILEVDGQISVIEKD